jgi:hypothetical protein
MLGRQELPELDPRYFVGIGHLGDIRREAPEQGAHPTRPKRRPFRATLIVIFDGPIN